MDRTAYKNRHIKEHYDRINFVIPKGEKDRIKKILQNDRRFVLYQRRGIFYLSEKELCK